MAMENSRYDDDGNYHQQQRQRQQQNDQRRKINRKKKHTLWLLTMLSSIVRVLLHGSIGCGTLLISIAVPYSCNFFSYNRITTATIETTMLDVNTRVLQPVTTTTSRPPCYNIQKEKFEIRDRQDARTCGWYAYSNMCESIIIENDDDDEGVVVSDVCQKSCGGCERNEIHDAPASSLSLPPTTPSLSHTSRPPSQMVSQTNIDTSLTYFFSTTATATAVPTTATIGAETSSLLISSSYVPFEYLDEAGVGIFAYYMILPNYQQQDDDNNNDDDTGGGGNAIFYNLNPMCFLYFSGDVEHPYSSFQTNYKKKKNQINTDPSTTTTTTVAIKPIIDLWIVARYCSILAPIIGFIGLFLQFLMLFSEVCYHYYYYYYYGSITQRRRQRRRRQDQEEERQRDHYCCCTQQRRRRRRRRRHQEKERHRDQCCCCGSIATSIFGNRKRYSSMVVSSVILLVFAAALQLGTFSIMFASPTMSSGNINTSSMTTLDQFCFLSVSASQSSLYYYACRFDTGAWLAFGAASLYVLVALVVSIYCLSRKKKYKINRTEDDTNEFTDDDEEVDIAIAIENTDAFVRLVYYTVYPSELLRYSSGAIERLLSFLPWGGSGGNNDGLSTSTTSSAPFSQRSVKKEPIDIYKQWYHLQEARERERERWRESESESWSGSDSDSESEYDSGSMIYYF